MTKPARIFNAASIVINHPVKAVPISSYPAWFTHLRYMLNYARIDNLDPNGQIKGLNSHVRSIYEKAFPYSPNDYRNLEKLALRAGLLSNENKMPKFERENFEPERFDLSNSETEEARNKHRKETESRFVKWLNDLHGLMISVAPFAEEQGSKLANNYKLLSQIFEISPLEREILALLAWEKMSRFLTEQVAGDGDFATDYSALVTRCLDLKIIDDEKSFADDEFQGDAVYSPNEEIQRILFKAHTLADALLIEELVYGNNKEDDERQFYLDKDIVALLSTEELSSTSILSKVIGLQGRSQLDYPVDCDHLDFKDELVNACLGMLSKSRNGNQGRVILLRGVPGTGKTVLPASLAAYLEKILRTLHGKYELPVFIIGTDEEGGLGTKKRRGAKSREDDEAQARSARERDIRRFLRARRILKKLSIPAILQVEEADGILASIIGNAGDAITRALLNEILDQSANITFLITNHPQTFDAAAARRILDFEVPIPPPYVRTRMILGISKKFGIEINPEDARTIGREYVFAPGVIESALQYLWDIKEGQKIRGIESHAQSTLEELHVVFNRKGAGLAGTNVMLTPKTVFPSTIIRWPGLVRQKSRNLRDNPAPWLTDACMQYA
jgi:hypothetical protein